MPLGVDEQQDPADRAKSIASSSGRTGVRATDARLAFCGRSRPGSVYVTFACGHDARAARYRSLGRLIDHEVHGTFRSSGKLLSEVSETQPPKLPRGKRSRPYAAAPQFNAKRLRRIEDIRARQGNIVVMRVIADFFFSSEPYASDRTPWKIGSVFVYPALRRPLRSAALKSMNEFSLANPRGIADDAPAAPAEMAAMKGGTAEQMSTTMGQLELCVPPELVVPPPPPREKFTVPFRAGQAPPGTFGPSGRMLWAASVTHAGKG